MQNKGKIGEKKRQSSIYSGEIRRDHERAFQEKFLPYQAPIAGSQSILTHALNNEAALFPTFYYRYYLLLARVTRARSIPLFHSPFPFLRLHTHMHTCTLTLVCGRFHIRAQREREESRENNALLPFFRNAFALLSQQICMWHRRCITSLPR